LSDTGVPFVTTALVMALDVLLIARIMPLELSITLSRSEAKLVCTFELSTMLRGPPELQP
jgi:hypothetical protein